MFDDLSEKRFHNLLNIILVLIILCLGTALFGFIRADLHIDNPPLTFGCYHAMNKTV